MVATVQQTGVWNDAAEWLTLARGPFGEILPPDLSTELTAAEQGAVLIAVRYGAPDPGRDPVLLQQLCLRAALGGQLDDDVAAELRHAVLERHELLSLRPLGLEQLECHGLVPVVQYLGGVAWRVGLAGQGRIEFLVADDPAQALAQAQQFFARWYQEHGGTVHAAPWAELAARPELFRARAAAAPATPDEAQE